MENVKFRRFKQLFFSSFDGINQFMTHEISESSIASNCGNHENDV